MKSSEHVSLADAEVVNRELKGEVSIQKRGKFALHTPSRLTAEVGKFALCNGTQAAKKRISLKYPQYEFKRSTVNNWKKKISKDLVSREDKFTKVGRPNKVNDVVIGILLSGVVISRKMVISIGTGVLKTKDPN